jgi:SAM-dependent methyltransferase
MGDADYERGAASRNLWQCRATMTVRHEATRWRARTDAILDVARGLAEGGPAPRGRPFFGLDHASGTPLGLIDDLATRGIFRKYEHVLDLGAGLGATTRYLTTRLGCTATATAATRGEAAAGRLLTARAALDWQVFHAVANPTCLPFAEAAFTHVWIVDVLPGLGPTDRVLAEAFRVLRPGGHLGVQERVIRRDDPTIADHGFVRPETRQADLGRAGFLEIVRSDVDTGTEALPHRTGWSRLAHRLGADDAMVRERDEAERALSSGVLGLVRLTARRP